MIANVRDRGADPVTVAALAVSLVAISLSGPLIAYAAAPALAIAFWRNAFAVGVLVPAVATRRAPRAELRHLVGPGRRELVFCLLAGLALSVHFGLWVPSLKLTSVATATALVCIQPVWQGLIAYGQGKRLPRMAWFGIGTAVAGAAVATGVDFTVSTEAVVGDMLALGGGVAGAVYTAFGERARVTLSTTTYTTVCYATCALALLPVCLLAGQALGGYVATAWLAIAALTAGPQLLGHSMMNFALRRVAATTVAVLVLLEIPGAALISWAWLKQTPPAGAWPGLALILVGVGLVIVSGRRARDRNPTPHEEPADGVIAP